MVYFSGRNLTPYIVVVLWFAAAVVCFSFFSGNDRRNAVKVSVVGYEIDTMRRPDGTFFNDTISILYKEGKNNYTLLHLTKDYRK